MKWNLRFFCTVLLLFSLFLFPSIYGEELGNITKAELIADNKAYEILLTEAEKLNENYRINQQLQTEKFQLKLQELENEHINDINLLEHSWRLKLLPIQTESAEREAKLIVIENSVENYGKNINRSFWNGAAFGIGIAGITVLTIFVIDYLKDDPVYPGSPSYW